MNLQDMAQPWQPEAAPQAQKPASPEQQEQFDMLLGRARQAMADTAQEWIAALEKDPVRAAVHMGTTLLRNLAMKSEKAGVPVDPAVLIHVGVTLVKDIAGIANDRGMVPDEKLEEFLQQVMQQSLAEYMRRDADDGLMPTPEGQAHESAESPAMEQQEAPEAEEPGEDDEDAMMARELAAIRNQRGVK